MFYGVLMEKKAQREQQDEQSRLSLGQKAGVVGAGALGATAGAGVLMGAVSKSKGFRDLMSHGTKSEQGRVERVNAERYRRQGELNKLMDDFEAGDVDGNIRRLVIPDEAKSIAAEHRELQKRRDAINAGDRYRGRADDLSAIREEKHKKWQQFKSALEPLRQQADTIGDEVRDEVNRSTGRRRRMALGGSVLSGGLLAAYGAKKFFDRRNARKQQTDAI